jgi:hypothetical protein
MTELNESSDNHEHGREGFYLYIRYISVGVKISRFLLCTSGKLMFQHLPVGSTVFPHSHEEDSEW